MSGSIREFFRSHPQVIDAVKSLEHLGLDAAEDAVLTALGQKFGIFGHLFPGVLDAGKAAVERVADGALDSLVGAPPAPTPLFAPAAAPAPAPAAAPASNGQTDPVMLQKQAAARARALALAESIDSGDRAAPGQRGQFVAIDVAP